MLASVIDLGIPWRVICFYYFQTLPCARANFGDNEQEQRAFIIKPTCVVNRGCCEAGTKTASPHVPAGMVLMIESAL